MSFHAFRKILLALAACLLIAGCASGEDDGDIAVTNTPDAGTEYRDMARNMSNGSVQIFSLDDEPDMALPGAMPPPEPLPPSQAMAPVVPQGAVVPRSMGVDDGGVPSQADPNVTVYPFPEDEGWPQAARPALSPPSATFRPLESPFGGPIQTPAPVLSEPPMRHQNEEGSAIFFRHGSSSVNEEGQQAIRDAARSGNALVVTGYASERAEVHDPVERSIVNLKMSMDRAFKVSSQLIRDGVPANAIETRAYGDARPAGAIDGKAGEAADRRVEIGTDGSSVYMMSEKEAPIPPLARY